MKRDSAPKTPSSKLVGSRTGEIAPLVALWIKKNPNIATSHLVRSALRQCKELRALAGKRYAHLVN